MRRSRVQSSPPAPYDDPSAFEGSFHQEPYPRGMPSWIDGADGSGFGIENLPLGIFATDDASRPGVAIGPSIVDLSRLIRERLVDDETLLDARSLNAFLAHGPGVWRSLRATLQRLLGATA